MNFVKTIFYNKRFLLHLLWFCSILFQSAIYKVQVLLEFGSPKWSIIVAFYKWDVWTQGKVQTRIHALGATGKNSFLEGLAGGHCHPSPPSSAILMIQAIKIECHPLE